MKKFYKDTVLKEAANLSQSMWWQVLDISIPLILGIISTHCNYLVIFLTLHSRKRSEFPIAEPNSAYQNLNVGTVYMPDQS